MSDAGASRHHASEGHASEAEDRVVLPKTEARQGVTGHNVRYVLIISTVCAIVALTLAYFFVLS
jgi:hypothetical protein